MKSLYLEIFLSQKNTNNQKHEQPECNCNFNNMPVKTCLCNKDICVNKLRHNTAKTGLIYLMPFKKINKKI